MEERYSYPIVLSIAGSDCSGGAGIQVDLKAISALGAYAATAITAITVQNTVGVKDILPIPTGYVAGQIRAVMDDLHPNVIKIGMVNDADIIRTIAGCLREYAPLKVIYDPVMVSTSGHRLVEEDAISVIKAELFPLCTLITPNLYEAEILSGRKIRTSSEMKEAANLLCQWGNYAVLLKGGHLEGDSMKDLLILPDSPSSPILLESPKVESRNTHGTGCSLSSAIAALCARGKSLTDAVKGAKQYVYQGILHGSDVHVGEGHGPLNHFYAPVSMEKHLRTDTLRPDGDPIHHGSGER